MSAAAEAITQQCTGCMACYAVCRHQAVVPTTDAAGFYCAVIDPKKCTDCGRCRMVCPQNHAAALRQERGRAGAVMVNAALRGIEKSSTSGLALVLAQQFMAGAEPGSSVVCGCVIDYPQAVVRHKTVENAQDLAAFCGSKYVQSKMDDAVLQVLDKVKTCKVLFIGTPCQVAGIKSMVPRKWRQNLTTVDLICHGVPSPDSLRKYLEHINFPEVKEINFRYRHNGIWSDSYSFKVEAADGRTLIEPLGKNLFLQAFLQNLQLNQCCYGCHWADVQRCGDITVGDFWNVDNIIADDQIHCRPTGQAVSLMLLNSPRGEELFARCCRNFEINFLPVDMDSARRSSGVLSQPSRRNKREALFKFLLQHFAFYMAVRLFLQLSNRRLRRRMKRAVIITLLLLVALTAAVWLI